MYMYTYMMQRPKNQSTFNLTVYWNATVLRYDTSKTNCKSLKWFVKNTKYTKQSNKELNTLLNDKERRFQCQMSN